MGGSATTRLVDRIRQPEYTGENRCIPCTVTNLVIAAVLSIGVAYAALVTGGTVPFALGMGAAVLAVCLAAIALRGYLVPGTPTLTKRYFPDWVLAKFDKEPAAETAEPTGTGEEAPDLDVERVLLEAGVLEPVPGGDLGLTDEFASEYQAQIERERTEDTGRDAIADVVGTDPDDLEFESYGGGAFVAFGERGTVGRWESRAAFLADAAAGRLVAEYYEGWDEAGPVERGQLLAGLRLFLERCPACDGPVRFGQEVVESCCRSRDVVAVTCQECDSRLFEVDASPEMLGEDAAA
jgi:hypothetical protein